MTFRPLKPSPLIVGKLREKPHCCPLHLLACALQVSAELSMEHYDPSPCLICGDDEPQACAVYIPDPDAPWQRNEFGMPNGTPYSICAACLKRDDDEAFLLAIWLRCVQRDSENYYQH